ncbi:MAG: DUF2842 domain-containing protein [Sneathiella sp.]|uniref:DUF2842 domain-containing protein n=1 Tax=Sneathiella sp. TaxID=1964365 RepID=UPI00300187F5
MNTRKAVGMAILIFLLVIYCLACMLIAVQFLPDSKIAELIYYPIVGVIWIFPAMKIVKWMQPPEPQ